MNVLCGLFYLNLEVQVVLSPILQNRGVQRISGFLKIILARKQGPHHAGPGGLTLQLCLPSVGHTFLPEACVCP